MLTKFIAFIATNRLHTMDVTRRLLTTFKKKHSLQYSKLQLAKSVLFSQLTTAVSSTSKQTALSQVLSSNQSTSDATIQHDIKLLAKQTA